MQLFASRRLLWSPARQSHSMPLEVQPVTRLKG